MAWVFRRDVAQATPQQIRQAIELAMVEPRAKRRFHERRDDGWRGAGDVEGAR